MTFTTCGCSFAFGVYQDLYQSMSLEPNTPFTGASPAGIDMVGTLAAALTNAAAPVAMPLLKRFSPGAVICAGACTTLVAGLLASWSTALWQFILTQGLLMGMGTCLAFMPTVTVTPNWYGARRGLAMGIILAGTGLGGLVWAPALHALVDRFGFRNALRISCAVTAAAIAAGSCVLDWDPVSKARMADEKARRLANRRRGRAETLRSVFDVPLVDYRIARSGMFAAQLVATTLQCAAYYTPVFFFSAYARALGYSASQGANFIALNNACNAIGKVGLGLVADKFGRVNMLLLTTAVSAIATLVLWLPSTLAVSLQASQGLFLTYAVAYGCFASAYVSLFPAAIVESFGPQNFASVNTFLYTARGMGALWGTPAAGAMIHHSTELVKKNYLHMSIFVSALLVASTLAVVWIKVELRKGVVG